MVSRGLLGLMVSGFGLFMSFAVSTSCAVDPPQKTQDPQDDSAVTESTTDQDIGGGGLCPGHSNCYCFCRAQHQCWNNPAQCNPLSACLNSCDAQTPGCFDDNGPRKPESIADCL